MRCALMGIISLAIGRLDHILIAGPMQTLKTEQQARTPVRLNHLHLTPQEEEDGRARLREFLDCFHLHVTF